MNMNNKRAYSHIFIKVAAVIVAILTQFTINAGAAYNDYYIRSSSASPQVLTEEGLRFLNESKPDSALICFSLVQNKTNDFKDDEGKNMYLISLDGSGVALFMTGQYTESYKMFQKAISTDSTHVNSHMNIAGIYLLFDDHERAISHLESAFRKYLNAGRYDEMSVALINLINTCIVYDRVDVAGDVINQFLKFDFDKRTPAIELSQHVAEGARSYQNGNFKDAIKKFNDALQHTDFRLLNGRMEVDLYGNLAKTWNKNGNSDSALYYLDKAIDVSRKLGNPDQMVWIENAYADILDGVNKHDEAVRHRYIALSLSDSIKTYSQFREITGVENQLKIDEFVAANEKLKAEKRERNIVITCLWIIIGLIVGFVIALYRKNKKLLQKNEVIYTTVSEVINDPVKVLSEPSACNEEESGDDLENKRKLLELADRIDSFLLVEEDAANFTAKYSLTELATELHDTPRNVGLAIKLKHGVNFNTYINKVRINLLIKRLKADPKYRSYTIEFIANDFGFRSRSNFNKVFSSIVGMTPSEWIKIESKQSDS